MSSPYFTLQSCISHYSIYRIFSLNLRWKFYIFIEISRISSKDAENNFSNYFNINYYINDNKFPNTYSSFDSLLLLFFFFFSLILIRLFFATIELASTEIFNNCFFFIFSYTVKTFKYKICCCPFVLIWNVSTFLIFFFFLSFLTIVTF